MVSLALRTGLDKKSCQCLEDCIRHFLPLFYTEFSARSTHTGKEKTVDGSELRDFNISRRPRTPKNYCPMCPGREEGREPLQGTLWKEPKLSIGI